MKVISLNIAKPTEISWRGKAITTGIYKSSVAGPIFLDKEGLENDAVIDRKYHGGMDQAVYAYGHNHYQFWKELYPLLTFSNGFFGENLTVSNLDETKIQVGDIYELGETIVK